MISNSFPKDCPLVAVILSSPFFTLDKRGRVMPCLLRAYGQHGLNGSLDFKPKAGRKLIFYKTLMGNLFFGEESYPFFHEDGPKGLRENETAERGERASRKVMIFLMGLLKLNRYGLGNTRLLHGDTIEDIVGLHRLFVVGDKDELAFSAHLF